MGWEFVAVWVDEPEPEWHWIWRRVADDSGASIHESARFADLDACLEDARRSGFDEDDCATTG